MIVISELQLQRQDMRSKIIPSSLFKATFPSFTNNTRIWLLESIDYGNRKTIFSIGSRERNWYQWNSTKCCRAYKGSFIMHNVSCIVSNWQRKTHEKPSSPPLGRRDGDVLKLRHFPVGKGRGRKNVLKTLPNI